MGKSSNYFSIPFDFLLIGEKILFDLYVNSSSRENKEKYVRVFPKGEILEQKDIREFKVKYIQLYVHESQRELYLKSLVKSSKFNDVEKSKVIKDSAVKYLSDIFDTKKNFNTEVLEETIQGCRETVESMVDVIKDYDVDEIQSLIGELSFHDFYTFDHSINVSMYSISLYRAVDPKASKSEITMAGLGGLLHDLGKIKISTNIINNPEKLTDEEFEEIKKHPSYGGELLHDHIEGHVCSKEIDFELIKRVVLEHHENFDGSGYPMGLKGDKIHLMARVVAIADFFDAITTKRSYHEVLSVEDALEVMAKTVGKKIDPTLFEIFVKKVKNLVLDGKSYIKLPDDFDPCQPHKVLPLEKIRPKKQKLNLFEKEEKTNKNKKKKAS